MKHTLFVLASIATILLAFDSFLPFPPVVPTWSFLLLLAASLWGMWFTQRRYDEVARHRDALQLHMVRTHVPRLMLGKAVAATDDLVRKSPARLN